MNKILLDTSILIDFLRRKEKAGTILLNLVDEYYQLYASIITHAELYAGKSVWEKRLARKELEKLFSGITILSMDESISQKAGQVRSKYNINLFDAIIAATAILTKLDLITLNVKDFGKIRGLKLLDTKRSPQS